MFEFHISIAFIPNEGCIPKTNRMGIVFLWVGGGIYRHRSFFSGSFFGLIEGH